MSPHDSGELRLEDLLLAFRRRIFDACKKDAMKYELTIPQIEILKFLEVNKSASMKLIADHLKITPPSATVMVAEMEKKGLVKRVSEKEDRRVVAIILTAKAEKFHKAMHERKHTVFHSMMERLTSADKKSLERIINILIKE